MGKWRNKKTGEIIKINNFNAFIHTDEETKIYTSLAELNEGWEEYEEPKKTYWYIDNDGSIYEDLDDYTDIDKSREQMGDRFDTKEEAELAVRKLKAWKRLKDKGFRFKDYERNMCDVTIRAKLYDDGVIGMIDELNLLFGGEE